MATEDVTTTIRPGCGTPGGYNTHRYYSEPACPWCREAHNLNSAIEYSATRRAVDRTKKAALMRAAKLEHAHRFRQLRDAAAAARAQTEAS